MHTESERGLRLPDAPADQRERLLRGGVAVWDEPLVIDTYEPAAAERLPMFFENRVYQGSSGRVYPIPFTEKISPDPVSRRWEAIHLENEWIRLVILPELGGRIHVGVDKTTGYDFFYRNSVIKPALVGLAGPWVSGGVEFNWPQHHRPATFLPMQAHIEHEDDGAVTVWLSDHDPFARMKGMHGIRVRPDSTLIELRARLHNRTEEPQTFLWWANVAAAAHEDYQAFFPTDVRYVADHAKRAITAFPRADRPYYGIDYPARVGEDAPDADRIDYYSNIPVPTSYMIVDTRDDFFGGYDHRVGAGFVHWADRRIAPGKKLWTWGNSPFGHAWDAHLTDHDGPYVELMAGVYTDNQPDFSYLAPGETKTFSQYWYPVSGTGAVHQASRDAAVSLEVEDGGVRVRLAASRRIEDAVLRVRTPAGSEERAVSLAPGAPVEAVFPVAAGTVAQEVTVELLERGERVLSWRPRAEDDVAAEPVVATEPPLPHEIAAVDELYVTGLHLAQYRHPTRSPEPYWEEILSRDPGDARANVALGASAFRRGEYARARELLRTAIARLTLRNPNPADGEAHYRLGLVELRLGAADAAYDAFAKAAWDVRWSHPAHLRMALIDATAGRDTTALECLDLARRHDTDDLTMRAARVVVLRRLGRDAEAREELDAARALDPLDVLLRVLDGQDPQCDALSLLDAAGDLRRMGADEEALALLEEALGRPAGPTGGAAPLAGYLAAELLDGLGRAPEAARARAAAQTAPDDYVFPAGLDAYDALRAAVAADGTDVRALHLLGMWLYDRRRREDALEAWDRALAAGGADPVLLRNAALASVEVRGDHDRGAELYERATATGDDPRLWYERDQLAVRRGLSSVQRLAVLEPVLAQVTVRDDLLIVVAELLTDTGRAAEAVALLRSRPLQPCEGGEGRAVRAYARACAARAAEAPASEAVVLLEEALDPPATLGETWHPVDSRAALWRALGDALEEEGRTAPAAEARARAVAEALAAEVDVTTADAVRAARSLGDDAAAERLRERVVQRIETLRTERARIDYFATSLPELLLFSEHPQARADRERAVLEEALAGLDDGEGRA